MAKGRYQELYEARMKRLGKNINKSESLQKQINNYKTKLEAGGADPTIDDRNAIEKLLNLEKDQNFIFDIFEILGRPQQAIFSGINAAQEGGSFLEGAAKGITGNDDETDFKKILMNTGEFEDEAGKFDLVDALGTAGDIFLDPMNIPVGGFSKVAKALDAGEGAFKALRNLDTVDDALFKAAGKGIKKGAKIVDTGIEAGLKHLDATKGVRVYDKHGNKISDAGKLLYANPNANRASDLIPDLQNKKEFGKSVVIPERGRLEKYKQMKDDARSMFKKSDASINAIVAKRDANNTADAVRTQIGKIAKDKENIVKEYASNNKTTLEQASEDVMLFAESHMDRTISKDDLLDIARDGALYANDNIIAAFDEMRSQVPQNVKFGLDLSVTVGDDGVIKLGTGWNKDVLSSAGIPSFNELDDSRKMVDYGNWYTDKDLKRIEKLRKDKKFREMFSKVVGEIKDGDKIVIDPLSNEIKILDGAEAKAKHRQFMRELDEEFVKKGVSKEDLMRHIRRTEVPDFEAGGGGYLKTRNSFRINAKIRNKLPLGKDEKTVKALDEAIANYKSKENVGLTRTEESKTIKKVFGIPEDTSIPETVDKLKAKIGKPIKWNDAFTSTAIGDGANAFEYERDSFMKIKAPKGTNMFVVNPGEREAILKRGQQMILRKVGSNSKGLVIELDLYDGEGRLIATITNDLIDNANKVFDTGFGSKLSQKFTDNSGYVPHTLADETVLSSADEFGQGVDTIVKGKTSILNPRKRLGSAREINNLWKQSLTGSTATDATKAFYKKHPRLFEENFNKAFTNKYYNDMVELGKQNKIINSVLVEQTFGNITEIKKLQKEMINLTRSGKTEELAEVSKRYNELIQNSTIKQLTKYDSTVPNGFTKITKEHAKDLKNKINKIKNVLGVDNKSYDNLVKLFDGKEGDIAINTDVLRMLEVPLDTKKTNEFVKMYDKWLKYFKTFKTLSPVNFLNNLVGNSSNLYLSGIDMLDQAKLMPKAVDIVKNGPELYNKKLIGEVLTPEQDEIAEYWKKFLETGFGSAESALELRDLQDLPDYMIDFITKGKANKKITAKDIALYLPKLNLKTGAFMDNVSRVTVMLKAVDDPSYLARLGIDGVNDAEKLRKVISKVMFDPSMLTDFERNVMRRVVPFYTYAKNNLVFQIDNLSKNANRYRKTLKGMENLQKAATGGNDENMEEYLKNNLYIPIPALDENGNYTMLRAQLPFGQLIEMTDDPIQQLVNMSGPATKGLYEFGTSIDSFTGRPIESFEGEKSAQLPFLTKKQQKLISDLTGLDVPLKNAYRLLTDPLSTVTMQRNIDTDKLARQYDEINELKTMMKQYQQEGYEFSTMNELKRANKNGVVGKYNSLFLKYGIE